jgi:hypothetical protein
MNATAATRPRKPAKPQKPLYMRAVKAILVDAKTGEMLGGPQSMLAPLTEWDARAIRDRGFKINETIRVEAKRPRNPKFNAMAHALGALLVEHCEGFEGMETHAALKKAQTEAKVCCDESHVELDLTSLGIGIIQAPVLQPQSIAFDSMLEEDFNKLVLAVCAYIREKYHGVPPEALAEIIAAVEERAP